METADLAFVNFSAGNHGAETVSSRTPASTAPLSTSVAVTLCAHTESNLQLGVGIDPSLREFAVGNQISARGVRLLHYKSASAGKSICGNRDAASLQQPNCALDHCAFNPRQPRRNISVALTFSSENPAGDTDDFAGEIFRVGRGQIHSCGRNVARLANAPKR